MSSDFVRAHSGALKVSEVPQSTPTSHTQYLLALFTCNRLEERLDLRGCFVR